MKRSDYLRSIAKNYLNEDEMDHLNRIVSMYLDYAELQAKNSMRSTELFKTDALRQILISI